MVKFLPYSEQLAPYFESINAEWINSMFVLEDTDAKVLSDPQQYIIEPGGMIWFAELDGEIVGCCALRKVGDKVFELTKMGVLAKTRGHKVGEKLLAYVLEEAKKMDIERLFLLTNKRCESAIHLYEKHGFEHCETVMAERGAMYERCNVAMRYPPIWRE